MRQERQWVWPASWTPVFALNLIVPLVLAGGVLDDRGWAGAYWGVAVSWALGFAACVARPALGRVLTVGGLTVACTQLVPVLQFLAGAAAVTIGGRFEAERPELYGFIDVLVTGGLLLTAAYLAGQPSTPPPALEGASGGPSPD